MDLKIVRHRNGMNSLPKKLRQELATDRSYKRCSLLGYHPCSGRITWEHVFTFGGKQIQKRWAIIPLCARGHAVDEWQDSGEMKKEMNQWVALNRASDDELLEISRAIDYIQLRRYLNQKYGPYEPPSIKGLPSIAF